MGVAASALQDPHSDPKAGNETPGLQQVEEHCSSLLLASALGSCWQNSHRVWPRVGSEVHATHTSATTSLALGQRLTVWANRDTVLLALTSTPAWLFQWPLHQQRHGGEGKKALHDTL